MVVSHLRLTNVYAPSGNDAAREQARRTFFRKLKDWTQEPGHLCIAGGDFNHNLAGEVPFPGHWWIPEQGTFRRSVFSQ